MRLDRADLQRILGVDVPAGVDAVSGVTHDSRAVQSGDAFVAVPGFRQDGAQFVPQALASGASLIVAERDLPGTPVAVVRDARRAMADLAREVHGNPAARMEVYGVTGTNGKTTTAYALHHILCTAYGTGSCGLTTTAEVVVGTERAVSARTTAEATEVQATLARMADRGVGHAVVEVSSHGIALQRIAGTRFVGAIFTNLTREHLDLHGSMEAYYATKRRLFEGSQGPKLANGDDAWGRRSAAEVPGVKTFGTWHEADYRIEQVRAGRDGQHFDLRTPVGLVHLHTPLLGDYNILNVTGAAALALEVGVAPQEVAHAVAGMPQVPGRLERISDGTSRDFEVIVDYAHTEVGLEVVLKVARQIAESEDHLPGRVVCVYGAAGERDTSKRPLMGRVASQLADVGVITTDDPYREDPAVIADEVLAGADPTRSRVILDRAEAIRTVIAEARPGDVIVVAGKGHEQVIHAADRDIPHHDATAVREALSESRLANR